jgi:hypothetical protein
LIYNDFLLTLRDVSAIIRRSETALCCLYSTQEKAQNMTDMNKSNAALEAALEVHKAADAAKAARDAAHKAADAAYDAAVAARDATI